MRARVRACLCVNACMCSLTRARMQDGAFEWMGVKTVAAARGFYWDVPMIIFVLLVVRQADARRTCTQQSSKTHAQCTCIPMHKTPFVLMQHMHMLTPFTSLLSFLCTQGLSLDFDVFLISR